MHEYLGEKMAKKTFFAILATEATIENTVADLGIVICDREGRIHNQCAILIAGHYDGLELLCDENLRGNLRAAYLERRRANYEEMIDVGMRIVTSVDAVNRWINQVINKYDPILIAHGLDINVIRCQNTGIDVSNFSERFCFRDVINANVCNTEKYSRFVIENNLVDNSGKKLGIDFEGTIENIYRFVSGRRKVKSRTALEDARDFEIPILLYIVKKRDWKKRMVGLV